MPRSALVGLTILALCLTPVLGACGNATETVAEPQAQEPTVAQATDASAEESAAPNDEGAAEVPAYLACDPQTLGFPLPESVRDCQSFDILTTYRTDLAPADVATFYADYLEPKGWTRTDVGTAAGWGSWDKEQQHLELVAGLGQDGTDVQIKFYTE